MGDSKQKIISIGREHGSGGRTIAMSVAKKLNIKLLDRNLLNEMGREKGYDTSVFEAFEEKPKAGFLHRTTKGHTTSIEKNLAEMQFEYLRELADKGESFVIVGRCAEYVLEDYADSLISFFIRADIETKRKQLINAYGVAEEEALKQMRRIDKFRKDYHNQYCPYRWGDSREYDFCINSGVFGIEGTAELIGEITERRFS